MRDGSIYAAQNEEVKERLVLAFLQHADALLKDLQSDRAIFLGDHLDVVDALLADASDKTAYRVSIKMAAARAEYQKFESKTPIELQNLIPRMYDYRDLEIDEKLVDCPACPSTAMAHGYHDVEWIDDTGGGEKKGQVWFHAHNIRCPVCNLWLTGFAEVSAVMDSKWEVTNADPSEWESILSDAE